MPRNHPEDGIKGGLVGCLELGGLLTTALSEGVRCLELTQYQKRVSTRMPRTLIKDDMNS